MVARLEESGKNIKYKVISFLDFMYKEEDKELWNKEKEVSLKILIFFLIGNYENRFQTSALWMDSEQYFYLQTSQARNLLERL